MGRVLGQMATGRRAAWAKVVMLAILAMLAVVGVGVLAGEPRQTGLAATPTPEPTVEPRRYYVTKTEPDAPDAPFACAEGYHMASLWEIFDPSALAYAEDEPDAQTQADVGSGPPVDWWGWIRTGNMASITETPGWGNCNAWTTSAPDTYGTIVSLGKVWGGPDIVVSPWQADTWRCSGSAAVWCVEGPVYWVWLPVVRN